MVIWKAWGVYSDVPLSYEPGSYVNLTCWDNSKDFLYVIWNIWIKIGKCRVGFKNECVSNCRDGLFITKENTKQTILHIPNFSERDVGFYSCEAALDGDQKKCNFTLSVITPPRLSSWLEKQDGGKLVAVCKAEGGNPAANITWNLAGNLSVETKQSLSDHSYTTESRLTLPEHYHNTSSRLFCSVTHAAWAGERRLSPQHLGLPFYLVCIISVFIAFFVLVGISLLLYNRRKFLMWRCRGHADHSIAEIQQQKEDVEEVEPYASYVQRVNSIYNS